MYSYKINNSYTVYVNYAYINECIKASRKYNTKTNSTSLKPSYVTPAPKTRTVSIGSQISVFDLDTCEKEIFTITDSEDINIDDGIISHLSPVGRALLGHKVGEIINIPVPAGSIRYKIVSISTNFIN